jgi:hypothetical protein
MTPTPPSLFPTESDDETRMRQLSGEAVWEQVFTVEPLVRRARSEPRPLHRPVCARRCVLRRGLGLGHATHCRHLTRNWRWGLALGAAGAVVMALVVLRTEGATDRPGRLDLVGAVLWRGVLYAVTDGVLLSVFPILAVFAVFAGTPCSRARGFGIGSPARR